MVLSPSQQNSASRNPRDHELAGQLIVDVKIGLMRGCCENSAIDSVKSNSPKSNVKVTVVIEKHACTIHPEERKCEWQSPHSYRCFSPASAHSQSGDPSLALLDLPPRGDDPPKGARGCQDPSEPRSTARGSRRSAS